MCVISVIQFLYGKFKSNEEVLKELLKDIQYVKGWPLVFHMPSYIIKSGKSLVQTGEYFFFDNEIFTCAFTISPFINIFSPYHHED